MHKKRNLKIIPFQNRDEAMLVPTHYNVSSKKCNMYSTAFLSLLALINEFLYSDWTSVASLYFFLVSSEVSVCFLSYFHLNMKAGM